MTGDSRGEMEANHNLGLAYEAQSNFAKVISPLIDQSLIFENAKNLWLHQATGCHERHLTIADKENNDDQRLMARQELKRAYFAYAEQLEANAEIATVKILFCKLRQSISHNTLHTCFRTYRLQTILRCVWRFQQLWKIGWRRVQQVIDLAKLKSHLEVKTKADQEWNISSAT